jgi:hypothetical protein
MVVERQPIAAFVGEVEETCVYDARLEYTPVLAPNAGPYPNPNGQWAVGYSTSATLPYVLESYDESGPAPGGLDFLHCFYTNDPSTSYTPSFCQNLDAIKRFGISPGQIALTPYVNADYTVVRYSVLRWYAPKPGVYLVNAIFYSDGDTFVDPVVSVSTGSREDFGGGDVDTTVYYNRILTLDAPEAYVDFLVGPGTDGWFNDATPIDVVIQDVRCIAPTG